MACDMLEPRKFPSLDGCQKRFLRTHKAADTVGMLYKSRNSVPVFICGVETSALRADYRLLQDFTSRRPRELYNMLRRLWLRSIYSLQPECNAVEANADYIVEQSES